MVEEEAVGAAKEPRYEAKGSPKASGAPFPQDKLPVGLLAAASAAGGGGSLVVCLSFICLSLL